MERSDQPHSSSPPAGAVAAPPNGEELLRVFLLERDVPCPVCRYNLRTQGTNRCPECGSRLALTVGAPEVRTHLLLLAIAPAFLLLGIAILFVLAGIAYGSPPPNRQSAFIFTLVGGAIDLCLVIALFNRRQRFLTAPTPMQRFSVAISWLFNALVFAAAVRTFIA